MITFTTQEEASSSKAQASLTPSHHGDVRILINYISLQTKQVDIIFYIYCQSLSTSPIFCSLLYVHFSIIEDNKLSFWFIPDDKHAAQLKSCD